MNTSTSLSCCGQSLWSSDFQQPEWWSPLARFRTSLGNLRWNCTGGDLRRRWAIPPSAGVAGWDVCDKKEKEGKEVRWWRFCLRNILDFGPLPFFGKPFLIPLRPQSWAVSCAHGFRIVSLYSVWKEPGSRIHIYVNSCCFFGSWLDFWMKSRVQKKSTVWYPDPD